METFAIEMPKADDKKAWDAFNNLMQEIQEAQIKEMDNLSEELDISFNCASLIMYLRTRSRWTLEREQKLIQMDKEGKTLPLFYEV